MDQYIENEDKWADQVLTTVEVFPLTDFFQEGEGLGRDAAIWGKHPSFSHIHDRIYQPHHLSPLGRFKFLQPLSKMAHKVKKFQFSWWWTVAGGQPLKCQLHNFITHIRAFSFPGGTRNSRRAG